MAGEGPKPSATVQPPPPYPGRDHEWRVGIFEVFNCKELPLCLCAALQPPVPWARTIARSKVWDVPYVQVLLLLVGVYAAMQILQKMVDMYNSEHMRFDETEDPEELFEQIVEAYNEAPAWYHLVGFLHTLILVGICVFMVPS